MVYYSKEKNEKDLKLESCIFPYQIDYSVVPQFLRMNLPILFCRLLDSFRCFLYGYGVPKGGVGKVQKSSVGFN